MHFLWRYLAYRPPPRDKRIYKTSFHQLHARPCGDNALKREQTGGKSIWPLSFNTGMEHSFIFLLCLCAFVFWMPVRGSRNHSKLKSLGYISGVRIGRIWTQGALLFRCHASRAASCPRALPSYNWVTMKGRMPGVCHSCHSCCSGQL